MLSIQANKASKRFQYEWIFKNLSLDLKPGESMAITGGNGSGKSTLIKCLTGAIPLSEGEITYKQTAEILDSAQWYQHLSIAAPYLELPEEFTLVEVIDFHFKFKKSINGTTPIQLSEILYLENHLQKPVSQLSSGMKQRLKLGLALFSDVSVIFLDEPTSNLDRKGVEWYSKLIEEYQQERILIIGSNEPREYTFCGQKVAMEDFK
jgi:ABC-type multidrug transport system ATPase subunit